MVGEIRELIPLSVIFIFRGRPRAFTSTSNEGTRVSQRISLMRTTKRRITMKFVGGWADERTGKRTTPEHVQSRYEEGGRAVKRDDKKTQRGCWSRRHQKTASYRNIREQKVGRGNCIFRLMQCITPPFCPCLPKDFIGLPRGPFVTPTHDGGRPGIVFHLRFRKLYRDYESRG